MKFDDEPGDPDQELRSLWQKTLPGGMDAAQVAREIASKVEKFDRRIRWRNLREYAAGAILIAYFSFKLRDPSLRLTAAAGIAVVVFVMAYLWRSHRQLLPLDPAADARAYQAALLARYDRQIRLLSRVKYWYVLPLYLWMLLNILITVPSQQTARRIRAVLVVTALSASVAWLNEGWAAKKLKEKRKKAEALLEEEKNEERT